MSPDKSADPAGEAAQEDEVMEREGLEEELMQEGRSEDGEHIEDASEVEAEPMRRRGVVENRVDRKALAADAGFGSLSVVSILAGVLTAYGAFVLLLGIAVAIVDAVGIDTDLVTTDYEQLGVVGGLIVAALLLASYLFGGYVAGRMARRAGALNGLAVARPGARHRRRGGGVGPVVRRHREHRHEPALARRADDGRRVRAGLHRRRHRLAGSRPDRRVHRRRLGRAVARQAPGARRRPHHRHRGHRPPAGPVRDGQGRAGAHRVVRAGADGQPPAVATSRP